MLQDEEASPEQIKILREIPGERRLKLAEQLYWSARKWKAAGLRSQHPDWPEEQINAEVIRIFLKVEDNDVVEHVLKHHVTNSPR